MPTVSETTRLQSSSPPQTKPLQGPPRPAASHSNRTVNCPPFEELCFDFTQLDRRRLLWLQMGAGTAECLEPEPIPGGRSVYRIWPYNARFADGTNLTCSSRPWNGT